MSQYTKATAKIDPRIGSQIFTEWKGHIARPTETKRFSSLAPS